MQNADRVLVGVEDVVVGHAVFAGAGEGSMCLPQLVVCPPEPHAATSTPKLPLGRVVETQFYAVTL